MSDTKKHSRARIASAMVGTVALAGSLGAVPALADSAQPTDGASVPVSHESVEQAGDRGVLTRSVEGTFGYSQDVVTSNERIASVFRTAAASFCSSVPDYAVSELAQQVKVGGTAASQEYVGTVADMAGEDETTSYLMACSCASNIAGGGAIANAEVSGVSLESVAQLVGAM